MNKCDRFHDLAVEAFYEELGSEDKAAFDAHLSSCASCAAEYKDMAMTLKVMNKRERRDPGPEFWEGYWGKLEKRLDDESPSTAKTPSPVVAPRRPRRFFGILPGWAWQGAAAVALVAVGILIGKTVLRQPDRREARRTPPPVAATPGVEQASNPVVRAQDYFERSKLILLGLVNYDPRTQDPYGLDFPAQKKLSRELVNEAGDLKKDLKDPDQKRLRELVSDLETILVQIANLESANDFEAVEFVKQGVDRKGIFLKINLSEMRPSKKASPNKPSI
jgi:hypothetical protein